MMRSDVWEKAQITWIEDEPTGKLLSACLITDLWTESSEVSGNDVSDVVQVESEQPQQQLIAWSTITVQPRGTICTFWCSGVKNDSHFSFLSYIVLGRERELVTSVFKFVAM